MNIWDSVQRGLEKASQEAARIAKTQRLRSTIDNLSRQVYTQHDAIVSRTMDLFTSGQLTQSELIPLCQELINIHNQLNQAQNELQLVQAPPPAPPPPAQLASGATPIPQTPSGIPYQDAETVYAPPPPDYQLYVDSTVVAPTPPPPPGMESPTVSSMETMAMNEPRLCFVCHTEIVPGNAFCHNCGTPVTDLSASYLPTRRGSVAEAENMATVRSSGTPSTDQDATVRANDPSLHRPDTGDDQATVRANEPAQRGSSPGDDAATVRADDPSLQRPATPDGGR